MPSPPESVSVPPPPAQRVVARAAVEVVGRAVAGQAVVEGGREDALDRGVGVAGGIARGRVRGEVDDDEPGRGGVVGGVDAVAAVEQIGVRAAEQRVVAVAAAQRVDAGSAEDDVVAAAPFEGVGGAVADEAVGDRAADGVLDVEVFVRLRIAADARARREVDGHGRGAGGVVDRIRAEAAADDVALAAGEHDVVAGAAVEGVFAGGTDEAVGAVAAFERVAVGVADERVVAGRADDALDLGQRVALCVAADAGAGGEVDGHCGRRVRVARGVGAGAALEDVGAAAPDQEVVAEVAAQRVGRRGPAQGIGLRRTDDGLDAADHVAFGVAAEARAGLEIDRHGVGAVRVVDGVGAVAAGERVRARAADQRVVADVAGEHVDAGETAQQVAARPAGQAVVAEIAGERVGGGRPDDGFDLDEQVAVGVAAAGRAVRQVDGDRGGGGRVVDRVDAGAADQLVGAGPAAQGVRPRAAVEAVCFHVADQRVREVRPRDLLDAGQRVAGREAAAGLAEREIDRDRRVGVLVGHPVDAEAAGERVGRRAGDEAIGVVGTDHVLDGRQHVGGRVAAEPLIGDEVDGDARGRGGVVRGIRPRAAREEIRPEPADEGVVTLLAHEFVGAFRAADPVGAGAAVDRIGGRGSGQRVGVTRADDPLDRQEAVAGGVRAARGARAEVDRHARARVGVGDRVDAVAAAQAVPARAAFERVVAVAAVEGVGPAAAADGVVGAAAVEQVRGRIAGQRVGEAGAEDALDRGIGVARRIPGGGVGLEVDHDAGGRGRVVGGVDAVAADQRVRAVAAAQAVVALAALEAVGAETAGEHVRARAAGKRVGRVVAGDGVGVVGADDVFDPEVAVALGIGAEADRGREVDDDRPGRTRVARGVRAVAAEELVAAGPAGQRVVADAAVEQVRAEPAVEPVRPAGADQRIGVLPAGELVGVGRSEDALDADQDVAVRLAARAGAEPGRERDRDRRGRRAVVGRVEAGAAVEPVGSAAARQSVVAAAALQRVGLDVPAQDVVLAGADHHLDAGHRIGVGAVDGGEAREVDGERVARAGIVDRVDAEPARDLVVVRTADQRVVARAAVEGIGARARLDAVRAVAAFEHVGGHVADEDVAVLRADHPLDAGEGVALRVAAGRVAGAEVHGDAGRRAVVVDGVEPVAALDVVAARAAAQRVVAEPAVELVGAAAARDDVGAVAAFERVGGGRAGQRIVEGGRDDPLDAVEGVADGVPAARGSGREVDRDGGRAGVVDGVDAARADEGVRAAAPDQGVVAGPAFEPVGAGIAVEHIGVGRADEVLDAGEGVAVGVAADPEARTRVGGEVDRDRGRAGVVGRVGAGPADEDVGPRAAAQAIVAARAVERVGAARPDQQVRVGGADDALDVDEEIAFGIAPVPA